MTNELNDTNELRRRLEQHYEQVPQEVEYVDDDRAGWYRCTREECGHKVYYSPRKPQSLRRHEEAHQPD